MKKIILKTASKVIDLAVSSTVRSHPTLSSHIFYLKVMRRPLNLHNPTLFSEKLMKLKLDNYIKNPTVWQCVDKLEVRKYVKGKEVTEKNLPAVLDVYENANGIDFDVLPDKFALKCTHGAGFNVICQDKSRLDQKKDSHTTQQMAHHTIWPRDS